MKWLIIIVIMMSLIGSVMWVMPTPRQKFQAQLRLRARKEGFHVQIAQLDLPRSKGETEGERLSVPVYRLARTNLSSRERDNWTHWHVCRVDAIADTGLPQGWSWISGEGKLSEPEMARIRTALESLPDDVVALESTPIHLNTFWQEGDDTSLDRIKTVLEPLIEARI